MTQADSQATGLAYISTAKRLMAPTGLACISIIFFDPDDFEQGDHVSEQRSSILSFAATDPGLFLYLALAQTKYEDGSQEAYWTIDLHLARDGGLESAKQAYMDLTNFCRDLAPFVLDAKRSGLYATGQPGKYRFSLRLVQEGGCDLPPLGPVTRAASLLSDVGQRAMRHGAIAFPAFELDWFLPKGLKLPAIQTVRDKFPFWYLGQPQPIS